MGEYGEIIAAALRGRPVDDHELAPNLRGRLFFTALFWEALIADREAREIGAGLLGLRDIPGMGIVAETLEMKANGRSVTFSRTAWKAEIDIQREGFPESLLPGGLRRETITPPRDSRESAALAREQVKLAVRQLFAR